MANSIAEEIHSLVSSISQQKQRPGVFSPFIDFIQFPKYKSFRANERITFAFPLTVLVGQNGTGKTSLLHALFGAPKGSSTGNWWFGTPLDPIDSTSTREKTRLPDSDRSAFWYEYRSGQETHQVLKTRIHRSGNPDYWEPSRPVASYGMKQLAGGDRSPAISMEVSYLNFKTQLNAFDRCFYFPHSNTLGNLQKTKYWQKHQETSKDKKARIQDYLRYRSRLLVNVLKHNKTAHSGKAKMHKDTITLSKDQLSEVTEIIGRDYSEGKIVEHRFYETWGTSVLFTTPKRSYSDAFAGSGESAVVRLVHEVTTAPKGKLLLLDEPETSLHPGAQEKLLLFLLKNIKNKQLQIIIATHSPTFVRLLPTSAIRVLSLDEESRIQITENVNPDEAFYVIGHPHQNKINIVVEDMLAKRLVDAVLSLEQAAFASRFNITFRPGGQSAMKQSATVLQHTEKPPHFLFDGDSKGDTSLLNPDSLRMNETIEELDLRIKSGLNQEIYFQKNSNASPEDIKRSRTEYISFTQTHFHYLPFTTPESVLWDHQIAEILLSGNSSASEILQNLLTENDFKKKFLILATALLPKNEALSSTSIAHIHGFFLRRLCNSNSESITNTRSLLKAIAENA